MADSHNFQITNTEYRDFYLKVLKFGKFETPYEVHELAVLLKMVSEDLMKKLKIKNINMVEEGH